MQCGIIYLALLIPVLVNFFALVSFIFVAQRLWRKERRLIRSTEQSAFKLFDQMFQSLVARGLADRMIKAGVSIQAQQQTGDQQEQQGGSADPNLPYPPEAVIKSPGSAATSSTQDGQNTPSPAQNEGQPPLLPA